MPYPGVLCSQGHVLLLACCGEVVAAGHRSADWRILPICMLQTRDALTTDEEEELYQLEVEEEVQLATSAVSRAHEQPRRASTSSSD